MINDSRPIHSEAIRAFTDVELVENLVFHVAVSCYEANTENVEHLKAEVLHRLRTLRKTGVHL